VLSAFAKKIFPKRFKGRMASPSIGYVNREPFTKSPNPSQYAL